MRSAAWLALFLVACDGGTSTLLVDLRTDLRPAREFALVQVDVVDAADDTHQDTTFVRADQDAVAGVRVGDLLVANGTARVTVSLLDDTGGALLTRLQLVEVQGATATVVVMTSDCLGVVCAGETQCLNGECVGAECGPDNLEACGDVTCTADSDCPPATGCSTAVCRESFCLADPDDAMCGTGEFCTATSGCARLPNEDAGVPMDAGDVDAAAGDDAGPGDVDAGVDPGCPIPTSAVIAFDPENPIPAGWECVSCMDGQPLFQRFPRGAPTSGGSGGDTTHTHTFVTTIAGPTPDVGRAAAAGMSEADASAISHTHGPAMGSTGSASHVPPFADVIYLRPTVSTATLPAGAVVMHTSSMMPAAFTRLAGLDFRYLRGSNGPGEGGAESHQDTVITTVPASTDDAITSTDTAACVLAASTHTHPIDEPILQLNAPPFVDVILGQASRSTVFPMDAYLLFLDDPPGGWLVQSNMGEPAFERFFRGAPAPGAPDMVSDTHGGTHNRRTAGPSFTAGFAGNATCDLPADAERSSAPHTHELDIILSEETSLPPYVDMIVARRNGCEL